MRYILYRRKKSPLDITDLVDGQTIISGALSQVARVLDISVIRKGVDYYAPNVDIERGDSIGVLDDKGKEFYRGTVWIKKLDDTSTVQQLTCYDPLIYMNKCESKDSVFVGKTAESVAKQVIEEIGLKAGKLVPTGVTVKLNGRGKTCYEIMMSAYTEAKKETGKVYYPVVNNGKVDMIEKGDLVDGLILKYSEQQVPGALDSVSYEDSSETLVNKVVEINDEGTVVSDRSSSEDINKYGLIQKIQQSSSGETAKENIELCSGKKYITCSCIGDWRLRTGYSVKLKTSMIEAEQLYIESDKHSLENGIHTVDLDLSYENVMDEHEMKEEATKGGDGSFAPLSGSSNEVKLWNFFRGRGYSKEATAGILGNLYQESKLDPKCHQSGGGAGRGLAQWTLTQRWAELVAWAKASGKNEWDLMTQAEYIDLEMKKPYYANRFKGGLQGFKNSTSVDTATKQFHDIYEASADTPSMIQRLRIVPARGYFDRLGGKEVNGQVSSDNNKLFSIAREYFGLPYSMKLRPANIGPNGLGTSTARGTYYDCSSYVRAVFYRAYGVDIGSYTGAQRSSKATVQVSKNDLKPGDLVFSNGGRHVALYVGNGRIYHTNIEGKPCREDNLQKDIFMVKRYIGG
ncbi:murein DD-endopeptidase MepS/murein LD-carboxypeptidase precursor [Andreesenia angusta]|uniref:Murein DD-endopeptidase MepS/murein LD-carboxypeptidase n=1 Tax=Andreesenia angusta TaxID=39480 RepID=A0A1S1V6M7_9FIRM|nr:phage tail tip lysozyme [Andreesenia angusta]OHW62164.1 murein DD-endopeptidase MepS/murein LD-carboxypeptidase precursor [Andreesenia angusta]